MSRNQRSLSAWSEASQPPVISTAGWGAPSITHAEWPSLADGCWRREGVGLDGEVTSEDSPESFRQT